jgi:tRNA(His) 5'-end guanylyltransferase
MKFDDLDRRMRVFETAADRCVLPELYMVARIDGRNFTRLTKESDAFEAPFDTRFRDCMTQPVEHLLSCGFRTAYGYTQSDEISLLLHRDDATFGRKTRKLNSVLAGEASAKFALLLQRHATFDCRICELPSIDCVCDYFRWRQEDAFRNALNAHCYWMLRKQGVDATAATAKLRGISIADKNELLFQHGVNFNDLPAWQKRGIGVTWESFEKQSRHGLTGETVTAVRQRLRTSHDLPIGDAYSRFIRELVNESERAPAE